MPAKVLKIQKNPNEDQPYAILDIVRESESTKISSGYLYKQAKLILQYFCAHLEAENKDQKNFQRFKILQRPVQRQFSRSFTRACDFQILL